MDGHPVGRIWVAPLRYPVEPSTADRKKRVTEGNSQDELPDTFPGNPRCPILIFESQIETNCLSGSPSCMKITLFSWQRKLFGIGTPNAVVCLTRAGNKPRKKSFSICYLGCPLSRQILETRRSFSTAVAFFLFRCELIMIHPYKRGAATGNRPCELPGA